MFVSVYCSGLDWPLAVTLCVLLGSVRALRHVRGADRQERWAASSTSCGAGWWWCPSSRWETRCKVSETTASYQKNSTRVLQSLVSRQLLSSENIKTGRITVKEMTDLWCYFLFGHVFSEWPSGSHFWNMDFVVFHHPLCLCHWHSEQNVRLPLLVSAVCFFFFMTALMCHINLCRLYHITLWTFVLALGHFLSEAFIYKTAPLTIGVMAPLIVASEYKKSKWSKKTIIYWG